MDNPVISVVSPVFNEEESLPQFVQRTRAVLEQIGETFEIILVNDGSADQSLAVATRLAGEDPRLRIVSFSRNFGHEAASSAGLRYARGDAVVLIDSDLQDPPGVIASMVAHWRQGAQIVYGQRVRRNDEPALKKVTSWLFYRVLRRLAGIDLPRDTGDFRLMDRRVVDTFNALPERNRFVRGLICWTGYKAAAVPFERQARLAGKTKYNYWKLLRLAIDSITSFSTVPLRMATWLGIAVALAALLWTVVVIFQFFFIPHYRPPGFTFLYIALLSLGGAQIFLIGLIGEYLGRTYEELQRRPLYIVDDLIGYDHIRASRGPNGALVPDNPAESPLKVTMIGRIG